MATQVTESNQSLAQRYAKVRQFSDRIVEPLTAEDCMVQSMPDVSPSRWHLAHTTWFFETFVLMNRPGYCPFDDQFQYLFNSYYNTVGKQFPRPNRGMISRPGLARTKEYRAHVDALMADSIQAGALPPDIAHAIEVGLHHEQQHQELMLTDIKHVLSCNPTLPRYADRPFADGDSPAPSSSWREFTAGTASFGHASDRFCFDNELPLHTTYVQDYSLAAALVTCGEYIEFIEAGGYETPQNWLSLGWSAVNEHQWDAPLYWVHRDGGWHQFTLAGLVPVDPDWPVCHISYFEADAYARWKGFRLPTEFEWEHAARDLSMTGQFADQLMAADMTVHPDSHPRRHDGRGLGMDQQQLRPLPWLCTSGWSAGGIQRQVHVQSIRASRRQRRHFTESHTGHLSKFLPA